MDTTELNDVQTLCRICLTQRLNMTPLDSPFTGKVDQNEPSVSILEILQQVMSEKVINHEKYPSFICPSCKNLLKIAHEFNILFHNSQSSLLDLFKDVPGENLEIENTDVELIFAGQKFALEDVVIKEDIQEDRQTFDGFLNNLGSAVTASFVKKATTSDNPPETNLDLINPAREQYLCDICGHVNSSKARAKTHRQTHEGKIFECHICGKKFSYQISLNLHIKSHANVRNHLCTLCGKTFFYSNALVYHMRMHTNERNFKCNYCEKTFYMLSTLKRHTRTHTNDRPYVCGFCDKGFRSNGEKRKHEMVHTGEKPYKCRFCARACTSKYNLLVHHMAHMGPHECDYCAHSFIEVEFLRRHLKNKHRVEEINV